MVTSSIAISPGFEPVRPRALSRTTRELTRNSLDRLLQWLHPEREEAGRVYEQIRRKLIKIFTVRGCDCPEELADEAIDRVVGKVDQVVRGYQGDPSLYFYGVARNVLREYRKTRRFIAFSPPQLSTEMIQPELDCLDACLERLLSKSRDLLIEYYQDDGRTRIERRRAIAGCMGLEPNALRIRVHRIRSIVSDCTIDCLQHRKKR